MRNPRRSLSTLWRASDVGHAIFSLLSLFVESKEVVGMLNDVLAGRATPGFDGKLVQAARQSVLRELGAKPQKHGVPGVCADVIEAYCMAAGDPDARIPV